MQGELAEGEFQGRGLVLILVLAMALALSFCLPASGCLELLLRVAFWLSELFSLCVVRGVGYILFFFLEKSGALSSGPR